MKFEIASEVPKCKFLNKRFRESSPLAAGASFRQPLREKYALRVHWVSQVLPCTKRTKVIDKCQLCINDT